MAQTNFPFLGHWLILVIGLSLGISGSYFKTEEISNKVTKKKLFLPCPSLYDRKIHEKKKEKRKEKEELCVKFVQNDVLDSCK